MKCKPRANSSSFFYLILPESEEFGPVFIQEPDDVISSLDSDEKKVMLRCEARGNPPPTYRCVAYICMSLDLIAFLQLIILSFILFFAGFLSQLVRQWH